MNIELLKKYIKKIIQEEIRTSIKGLISEAVNRELKKVLTETPQLQTSIKKSFTENQKLNTSLNDIINGFDNTDFETENVQSNINENRLTQQQLNHPLLNKPLTNNPNINNILTDMLVNGYDHVKSAESMSPLGNFAVSNSYPVSTPSFSGGATHMGEFGPGLIQESNEEVWDIKKPMSVNFNKSNVSNSSNIPQTTQPAQNLNVAEKAITRDYRELMKKIANK